MTNCSDKKSKRVVLSEQLAEGSDILDASTPTIYPLLDESDWYLRAAGLLDVQYNRELEKQIRGKKAKKILTTISGVMASSSAIAGILSAASAATGAGIVVTPASGSVSIIAGVSALVMMGVSRKISKKYTKRVRKIEAIESLHKVFMAIARSPDDELKKSWATDMVKSIVQKSTKEVPKSHNDIIREMLENILRT